MTTKLGDWSEAKLAFYKIPNDFIAVLTEYTKNLPHRVKIDKQPRGTLYTISYEPILGYDVFIDIHAFKDTSKQTKAQYVMFIDRENRAAVRQSWNEPLG